MRRYALFLMAALCCAPAQSAESGAIGSMIGQCAACHGADGIAKSADVPHLAGQHELYLFNQLKAFRAGKRTHKEMRLMSRQLSDDEMAEIARYYASMKR